MLALEKQTFAVKRYYSAGMQSQLSQFLTNN